MSVNTAGRMLETSRLSLEGASQLRTARPSGLLFLHGLFGKPADWEASVEHFSPQWRVYAPELPVFDLPAERIDVTGLAAYARDLMDQNNLETAIVSGNSLGGHVGLALALTYPQRVSALVLAGSSGLFERGHGRVPRRPSREYLYERIREVFYDAAHVTDSLMEEVSQTIYDRKRMGRVYRVAASAKRNNLRESLGKIQCPVLVVWGNNDLITPPQMAQEFADRLPDAELQFIDRCGHAVPIERPIEFNHLLENFLHRRFSFASALCHD
ncbi:MAG: alpha/beta hydrolase [Candidatus Acidiferrales bacterium]